MSTFHPDSGRTCIFVCDIQPRFSKVIYNYDHVVTTARKMIKAAKILRIPVVVTEQRPDVFGKNEISVEELTPDLRLGNFPKNAFSMMIPQVRGVLEEYSGVVLLGIESHICILQTALDLLEVGKKVFVLADGVSSCNKEEIPIAFDRIRQAGGQVTTSESFLFQYIGDASSPAFRELAGLIKEYKYATAACLQALRST